MLTIVLSLIVFYLAICAVAYLYQARLIFPRALADPAAYGGYVSQQITLPRDNQKATWGNPNAKVLLHGWRIENPTVTTNTLAIYFGGNGEDVVTMLPVLQKMNVAMAYTFNYRGYGHSESSPSEAALFADALAIYDDIATRHDSVNTRIIIFGRSLGSAVAGYLASQRKTAALILMTPLNSAVHNGKRMLPFIPVALLIRHPFNLKALVAQVTSPVLMLIADADTVIPPRESLETYSAITSQKQLVRLPGVGHNNLFDNPNALKAIHAFIAQIT